MRCSSLTSKPGIKITKDMTAQDVEKMRAFRRAEINAIGYKF
jgi:hypothetical protein